jgi:hypothetical protein
MEEELLTTEQSRHSLTGASGASRWIPCPGSVQLIKQLIKRGIPVNGSGMDAALGTAAHSILASCFQQNKEPWEFAGQTIQVETYSFVADQDMIEAVILAHSFMTDVLKRTHNINRMVFIEKPIQHSHYEELYGTTDFAVALLYDDGSVEIIIIDYKHGRGVTVEPTSPQVKYYACLVVDLLIAEFVITSWSSISQVDLYIIQPRHPHPKGPIRSQVMTGEELHVWFETELLEAVKRTEDPNALLVVGEQCKWCPAKDHCPAIKRSVHQFDMSKTPEDLSPAEKAEIMLLGDAIKKYLERIEFLAYQDAVKGKSIVTQDGRGFKLVYKQANRVFKSGAEPALKAAFGSAAYTEPELKSPAQIEALGKEGKNLVARWAFKPITGTTLAPLSDKREPILSAVDKFKEVLRVEEGLDID